jgi:tRNA modification GTPase
LQGEFSSQVNELLQHLIELRRYVEAAIDFSEEEIDFLGQGQVIEKLERLQKSVSILLKGAQQGSLLQQGATLAIVGEPNVGKSSLLNRLTATDTAIVTEIAGTTRDVLRERIQIDGLPIQLVDTAGIRETTDFVEQAGIVRSWKEIEQADCILWVFDLSTERYPQKSRIYREILKKTHGKTPVVAVGNKLDEAPHWGVDNLGVNEGVVALSAKTGQGVDQLREKIKALVGFQSIHESPFIARRRHVIALERVFGALNAATVQAKARLTDCLAEELRYAQTALAELTGEITPDDLLGEIFSNFCVGK